jgi:hypothetical protein
VRSIALTLRRIHHRWRRRRERELGLSMQTVDGCVAVMVQYHGTVSGRGVLLPCGSNPLQGWQVPVAWHTACRLMSCFNIRPPCPGGVLRKSIIFAVQDR